MTRAAGIPQHAKPARPRHRFLLPTVVGCAGLAITAWTTQIAQSSLDAAAQARFREVADRVREEIQERLRLPLYGFHGIQGIFSAHPEAGYREFQRYVSSLNLPQEFPGVRGFGLVSRLGHDAVAPLEQQLRAEGAQGFKVRLAPGSEPTLFVARYAEPLRANEQDWGADLGAEPLRRHALQSAVRSGRLTFTRPIVLTPEGRPRTGFLLIEALYQPGAVLETVVQREQALVGLIYASVLTEEALEAVTGVVNGQVSLRLFGPEAGEPPLFAEEGTGGTSHSARMQAMAHTLPLRLGDHTLQLQLSPSRDFEALVPGRLLALPIAGVLSSLLLALITWLLITARDRAEGRARQLTADVRRLAAVAEQTANAVICLDPAMNITWVNEGFTQSSGYALDEVKGRPPWDVLSHGGSDPQTLQVLAEARRLGQAARVEICNRHKDGHLYWIDILLQPLHNEQGLLEGFIEVGVDITERKQRESRHEQARAESDALLAAVARHAIVSVADARGRITSVNALMVERSGYGEAELLGQDHQLLSSGTHPSSFWQHMWAELKAGRSWRGQVCNRSKDGGLYWVDNIISPSLNSAGDIERYVSIGMDVTEARRASDHLRLQHTRLTNIIEGTAAGTWELRVPQRRIECDRRCTAILGYGELEQGSMSLDTWLSWVHPQDREAVRRKLDEHLQGLLPSFDAELRLRHRAGHWVWVQSTGRIAVRGIHDEPLWVTGLQLDITRRKLAELQLKQQGQLLDRAERLAGIGAWELDLDTQTLNLTAQAHRLLQLEEHVPGTFDRLLQALGPDSAGQLQRGMEAALAGSVGWDFEFELRRPDGSTAWLRSVGEAEFDDSGPVRLVGAFADISQRRVLEAETQRSHRLLTSVLENLPCALSVFDGDLHLVAHNSQFRQLLGFPDALFERPPVSFESVIRFNVLRGEYGEFGDAQDVDAMVDSVVDSVVERAQSPTFHQFERTRPNGTTLEVRGAPMPGGGFVTTYVDVTERKRLEQIRERLTEQMSAMLQALPCGLTVYNSELEITLHNDRFSELYGLSPEVWARERTSLGDVVSALWSRGAYEGMSEAEAQADALERARDALAGPCTRERYRSDADLHLEIRSQPLPSGGYVSTYMDVTEQRRTLQHLHQAESLLRGAIDTINEAFVLFDPQDRLVYCNDKYRELYAASADMLRPGVPFEDIVRTGALRGQYAEAIGRTEEWVQERVAAHRQGGTSHVQALGDGRWIRVIEQRMADGHTVGFRVDITDLILARKAAEHAAVAKGQFLANMSHEIRTPMNAILGLLQLLDKTRLDPRQKGYTDKLAGAARSLLALLNDILDFSKIETGKMTLEVRPFALDPMMRDLATILSATVQDKPVRLYFDLDPALPPMLEGDALRLQQVLVNLGANAVKFTPEGSVVISVHALRQDERTLRLRFAVRDSGIGIAPEHQQRIFSGFTQAEASTTRRFGGTGLGLAISARLVELMGGSIQVESAPGEGSCFSFELPLASAPLPDIAVAELPPWQAVVLGEPGQQEALLERLARQAGASSVLWAREPFLEAVLRQADGPAVLLLDTLEPQGAWVERVLALRVRHPGLRVRVLTTAQGQQATAHLEPAADPSEVQVLVMPLTAAQLRQTLDMTPRLSPQREATPAPQRLQGARLLLVEDNATNQQVALELLADEGARVELADNGALALDRLRRGPADFDAVLMDVQMPVMDGLTATRRIRAELGLTGLPVIAMTANAMADDQRSCQEAGMNAFVGKPLDLELLVRTLLTCCPRWSAPPGTHALPPAPSEPPETAAPPSAQGQDLEPEAVRRLRERLRQIQLDPAVLALADRQGIALQAAMERVMGKPALLLKLCEGLQSQVQALPGVLQAAREAGELAAVHQALHSIKGLAASLGAGALAETFRAAEQTCSEGRWPEDDALAALARQGQEGAAQLLDLARRLMPAPA